MSLANTAGGLRVEIVPCLLDNYAYLLSVEGADEVLVIDASEAAPIERALGGRRIAAILATHHHADHVGGHSELAALHPGVRIFGHAQESGAAQGAVGGRIPGQTDGLSDDEQRDLWGMRMRVLHVPGHTQTAVAYYFPDAEALFTGDTLFGAGCGRLFEGTPQALHASLKRLAQLPDATQIYCGHEYTERNLGFASLIEPDSAAVAARRQDMAARRARSLPTVPLRLSDERATNPFLRAHVPSVQAHAAQLPSVQRTGLDEDEVFARLRALRNRY